MAVFTTEDKKELIVTCRCGCDDTMNIIVDNEDPDFYMFIHCLSGNWYRDQGDKIFRVIGKKLKKIWAIIRSKDYHYSELIMSRSDFEEFKAYINSFE